MAKENLVVIFGGRSSEHEVSCVSVQTVAKAVDLERYNMVLVGITKDGRDFGSGMETFRKTP